MNRVRALQNLILAAHFGLGLLIALPSWAGVVVSRQLFKSAAIGSFTAQAVLLGLWCGLSIKPTARRWMTGGIGAALIWALAVTAFHGWRSGGAKIAMLLWLIMPFLAVGGLATVLRRRGFYCQPTGDHLPDAAPDAFQFSLGQLFTVVTACALLFTLTRGLRSLGQAVTGAVFVVAGEFFAIMFGVQMLACLWTAFGRGDWGRRVWVPLLIACLWPLLLAYATGREHADYPQFLALALIQASVILSTLLGLRTAGYRLGRTAERVK